MSTLEQDRAVGSSTDQVAYVLTVSEVAREAQVAPSAVRFYEEHGLLTAQRTSGGQRRFSAAAPCLIKVAKVAQRVGLSVREIAALFEDLPPDPRCEDWQRVARSVIAEARARVEALEAQLELLGSDTKLCELE